MLKVIVKIGKRGQITIPYEIRCYLGIKEGNTVALVPQGGQAIMCPITETLLDLRGSLPVSGIQDFDAIRRSVALKTIEPGD